MLRHAAGPAQCDPEEKTDEHASPHGTSLVGVGAISMWEDLADDDDDDDLQY